eukprot:SAG25_NODE_32_length_20323_cov_59.467721_23_plen_138_part_00
MPPLWSAASSAASLGVVDPRLLGALGERARAEGRQLGPEPYDLRLRRGGGLPLSGPINFTNAPFRSAAPSAASVALSSMPISSACFTRARADRVGRSCAACPVPLAPGSSSMSLSRERGVGLPSRTLVSDGGSGARR